MVDEFVFLEESPLHIVLHLSRGGESIVECYILSPDIEKVGGIIVFGKFSCGAYVTVLLNSDIVVFPDMQNLFWLARRFLAWFCGIRRISLRCYSVPYTPSRSLILFLCACVYFCYKTGFDSVLLCPVAVLERFTKQNFHDNLICAWTISKAFILTDAEILWCSHRDFTLYHLLL